MKHSFSSKIRRLLTLILALVLVAAFAGCSQNDDSAEGIVKGTVSADNLNVRKSHSSDSKILSQLPVDLDIEILEQKTIDDTDWGRIGKMTLPDGTKIKGGWINLQYVKFADDPDTTEPTTEPVTEPVTEPRNEAPAVAATMGTITTGKLNIRKDAGSKYDAVGSYVQGERIEVLETKTVDDTLWGRTGKGWIGMGYVKMDGDPSSSNGAHSDGKSAILGYGVIDLGALNVRTGPGSGYDKVREAAEGTRYAYYQVSGNWARIEDGWVSTAYFYMEGTTAEDAVTGTITEEEVNIRSGPATSFQSVGTFKKGESVAVLGQVDGWGYTNKGWVSMKYVKEAEPTYTTGVGTITTGLNVRKEPNADSEAVDTYQEGDIVEITEVKDGWGKTAKGWINLKYVKFG